MARAPEERDRSLALLRSQHTFPGEYVFRVVVRPPDRPTILTAVSASLGGENNVVDVTQRSSRNGAYVALHIRVVVQSAEQVLDVYDVLQRIDSVLAAI